MSNYTSANETADLRYLDATHVEHPSGTLAGITVCTDEDEKLGAIDGVLVEPTTRRLRYFVVRPPAWLHRRRYLLPADSPAILESTDSKLRVEAHSNDLERFDARSVPAFSDDDLITAMFSRSVA